MKQNLDDIINKSGIIEIIGSTNKPILSISFNSVDTSDGCLFVAIKGTKVDGHAFISEAINRGAVGIVCEKLPEQKFPNVTYIKVQNSSYALGQICSSFYNHPSAKIKLIGVTGTNGKTTTASLLYKMFILLGYKVGLISTICNKINNENFPASHTTPDSLILNKLINRMVERGCEYCFMEVSSHAVCQERIVGLNFSGGIFSNITHDHLDYHKTFENYILAKKRFFDSLPTDAFALTNIDDRNGNVMIQNTKAKKYTYSLLLPADFKCKILENQVSGMHLNLDGNEVWCNLVGSFNAYNLTAIYATALLLNQNKVEVLTALSSLTAVEGRFESFKDKNNVVAIVDYAHTPDALKNILSTIISMRSGKEKIITVVGAGGDRDKTKRPEMARIVADMSDRVILTSDNPRSETPEAIIDEMITGVDLTKKQKILVIVNRKEAIKTAYALALPSDIILLAGKGHEKYQDIQGIKYPFDDKQIIKDLMKI
ncbi:MAG: UDP-N-acetylmuramoyl-L-alanyl-D-glutamate--2,6-diaminopimelate ligase [Bacteroidota bacterium]